jgi:hypothetical protein
VRSRLAVLVQMVDEVLIQGGLAAAAGLGVAIGGIYFIEKKAAAADADQMVEKMAGMGIAMEGAEGSNQFSGSDQSLDGLIAAMEEAQVIALLLAIARPTVRCPAGSIRITHPARCVWVLACGRSSRDFRM